MQTAIVNRWLAGAALFSAGIATTLLAQSVADSSGRVEKHRTDLSGAPGMEVVVSTGEYRPGEEIRLHSHHGIEALYVIQGAEIQEPDQPSKTLASGATMVNLRDVDHAGFRVVGDKSLKLFTVHVVDKNKPLYVYPR